MRNKNESPEGATEVLKSTLMASLDLRYCDRYLHIGETFVAIAFKLMIARGRVAYADKPEYIKSFDAWDESIEIGCGIVHFELSAFESPEGQQDILSLLTSARGAVSHFDVVVPPEFVQQLGYFSDQRLHIEKTRLLAAMDKLNELLC